nr:flowering time control protein FPA-like [Tanacetum cinerariifolium]
MSSSNLFVAGLPPDVTESELKKIFSEHGVVSSVTCYGSRNYGFVNMSSHDEAIRAKDSLNGFLLRHNKLTIQFAKPSKPCKCLWVTGINERSPIRSGEEGVEFKPIDVTTLTFSLDQIKQIKSSLDVDTGGRGGGTEKDMNKETSGSKVVGSSSKSNDDRVSVNEEDEFYSCKDS